MKTRCSTHGEVEAHFDQDGRTHCVRCFVANLPRNMKDKIETVDGSDVNTRVYREDE